MKTFTIFLCLIVGGINLVFSQTGDSLETKTLPDFSDLFAPNDLNIKSRWGVQKADNEVQFLFSNLFVAYKEFLSSQDNAKCNFHPSCSVFAIHAIQSKGPFIGILSAFDRLSRCNGMNTNDYLKNPKNNLLDDPVF